ncbi:MAG: class I SAM-dependent methyltransferase [Bacteroidota bacterium]
MSLEQNKIIYSNKESAEHYSKDKYLLAPEKKMLNFISDKNLDSMLDIGVGAGRTTLHFAKYFKKYTAIDYSESMIEKCKQIFIKSNYAFIQQDARNLGSFPDNSFDFVMFSFNGIDCVSIDDRALVLNEVKRVLKVGGIFFFSVHNIFSIPLLYSLQLSKNPLKWLKEFKRVKKVNALNPKFNDINLKNAIEMIDGDIDFKAKYVYIKPNAQKQDLESLGFSEVIIYSLKNGYVIDCSEANQEQIKDSWVYYSCKKQ